jgi:3-oxoadipate enol-lactonase
VTPLAAALVMMLTTTTAALPHTRSGKGPAVVLVHGMGGDRNTFDDVAQKLALSHTVIAIDLPGHGGSPPPKSFDLDAIARQIAATVRQENAAPAVIVGHSLGGTITGHVPLVDPGVARAIVIVDSSIGPAPFSEKYIADTRANLARDRAATLRNWFAPICQPAQLPRVLEGVQKLSDETFIGYLQAVIRAPIADGGRAIGVPVLVMATRLLMPEPKKTTEQLKAAGYDHVAGLQLEFFDKSLHWPFWDEPAKFMQVLTKFLAKVEKR